MAESMSLEKVKEAMTCSICQNIATLPVHSVCCEQSKAMAPACLSCVRAYYELNKKHRERSNKKKSYNGCGCDMFPQRRNLQSSDYYQHTTQLDMVRNLLGPSKCTNEGCDVICETTAELRRHISGKAKENDKFNNCQQAYMKCKFCFYYNKRYIVEGEHYINNHTFVHCKVCNTKVGLKYVNLHYRNHCDDLHTFYTEACKLKKAACELKNSK